MLKRTFDGLVAAVGLAVLLPVFVLVGAAIKLDSAGPIFFRQNRIGRNFQPFRIYKFRTMVQDSSQRGPLITRRGDARVTRVGRVLRALKVDELPQLINVLKGEMSLVGPRPEVDEYVRMFSKDFGEILTVRPGITDLASLAYPDEERVLAQAADPVLAYRERILPHKIALSRESIRRSSLLFDLSLIFQTLFSVTARASRDHGRS